MVIVRVESKCEVIKGSNIFKHSNEYLLFLVKNKNITQGFTICGVKIPSYSY